MKMRSCQSSTLDKRIGTCPYLGHHEYFIQHFEFLTNKIIDTKKIQFTNNSRPPAQTDVGSLHLRHICVEESLNLKSDKFRLVVLAPTKRMRA